MKNEVLYEDNHLIAVNKAPSDIVQGDKTGDTPLSDIIKEYLVKKYNKPGEAFLGVPHRLDRPTSGVIIYTKTSKGLSRMARLFQQRKVKKTYWAVVGNKPEKAEGTLVHHLIRDRKKNKSRPVSAGHKKGKEAVLHYKVLHHFDNYHLLEVQPETGRHHQIRVQLSAIGCPIKGDLKYGFKRSNKDASIHLHARKAEFTHPVKNEPVVIEADPPESDSIWSDWLKSTR